MPRRRPNHRLVKIHRSYSVDEVARLFEMHRNTVREWVKRGLPTCDGRRPTLILGGDLVAFLQAKRLKNRRTCEPGQLYCVRCRLPRNPAGALAEYRPAGETLGTLVGICPECDAIIYRRVNPANLDRVLGNLEVSFPLSQSRLDETKQPFLNSDFSPGPGGVSNAQP